MAMQIGSRSELGLRRGPHHDVRAARETGVFLRLGGLAAALAMLAGPATALEPGVYRGLCDASAAVALGADHFVVGDDEHNVLKVYRRGQPDPAAEVPLQSFLGTKKDKESDIEGAAAIGSRIF